MTLVMARQWDDRIVMLSDTMISDRNARCPDIIPGQLKAIVLTRNLSVAYAGRANRALDTIREVRKAAYQGSDLEDVLEHLCEATTRSNDDIEFLVASHHEAPVLFKIRNGQISSGAGSYWIGDPSAASAVLRAMESQAIREIVQKVAALDSPSIREMGEWYLEQEVPLRLAFADVIRESPFPGVGGFSFTLLGSPLGHCYIDDGGFFAWDTIKIGEAPTPEYRRFEKTGTAHYQFSLTVPQQRGAGVTGAFLPQVELGFIYSPLQSDSVFPRPGITLEVLSSEVNKMASELLCSGEFTA